MASGKHNGKNIDSLTKWALSAVDILNDIHPEGEINGTPYPERMLMLVKALDQGEMDSIFEDVEFLGKTEDLLLAMLRGEKIEVADPTIFDARNEILAAAQVIYNQAVARGFWELHPEIRQAMDNSQ